MENFKISTKNWKPLTLQQFKDLLGKTKHSGFDERIHWDVFLEATPKEQSSILHLLNTAITTAVSKLTVQCLVNVKSSFSSTFFSSREFPNRFQDYFPVILYVSQTGESMDELGLFVNEQGKVELFEGNDEADSSSYDLLAKLQGTSDNWVTVFSAQPESRYLTMKMGNVPDGVYCSPDRTYASRHWATEESRLLLQFQVQEKFLRKESDVDWRVMEGATVKLLKVLGRV